MLLHSFLKSDLVLAHRQSLCGGDNKIIHSNNVNINQMPLIIHNHQTSRPESNGKQICKPKTMRWTCLLLIVLFSSIGYGIMVFFSIRNTVDIGHLRTSNNLSMKIIGQLQHRVEQLEEKRNS
jgi:hypothetical protein